MPAKYDVFTRTLPTLTLNPGGAPASLRLPTDLPYLGMHMRLTGNLTVTVADATLVQDGILNLISQFLIRAGSVQSKIINAETLFKNNWFYSAFDLGITQPGVTLAGSPNAFVANFYLDMTAPELTGLGQPGTLWDPRDFSEAALDVTAGAATTVATPGGAGAVGITSPALEVNIQQVRGVDARLPNGKKLPIYRETPLSLSAAGAGNGQQMRVTTGGLILGFDFQVETGASGGTNSNTAVTNLKCRVTKTNGANEYPFDQSWAVTQSQNRKRYSPTAITGANAPDTTGFAKIERKIDTRPGSGVKDVDVLIDVAAASLTRVNVRELIDG